MTIGDLPQNVYPEPHFKSGKHTRSSIDRKFDIKTVKRASISNTVFNVTDNGSKPILNDKFNRSYLLIQNHGATSVFLNFGRKATTNDIEIIAGGNYEPLTIPVNSIYLINSAGNESLCVLAEGTEIS